MFVEFSIASPVLPRCVTVMKLLSRLEFRTGAVAMRYEPR